MKAHLKDGTTIECTPQEYKELVDLGLVGSAAPKKEPTTTAEPVKEKTVIVTQPKKKEQPEKIICTRGKWSEQDREFIKQHRKMSMNDLAEKLDGRFSPKAIRSQLYKMAAKGEFPRSDIGKLSGPKISRSRWSEADDQKLIELVKKTKSYTEASKVLGRTYRATKIHFYNLIDEGKVSRDVMPLGRREKKSPVPAKPEHKATAPKEESKAKRTVTHTDAHRDYLRKRMKFMNSRAKELCRYDKTLSYERAVKRASTEWDEAQARFAKEKKSKKSQVSLKDLEFPDFSMVAPTHMQYVEDMVRNMIANKGKIGFRDMFSIMTVNGDTRWDGYMWQQFLAEFIALSDRIAKCFSVDNKFNVQKDGQGYDIIHYGY